MDAMDTWLTQVDADTVNEHAQQLAYAEKPEPFWPPADRSGTDPQVGDRLVLWQMGTGEKAGAVALGTVAETDVRYHEQNYQLKAAESELRQSARMNFTHWFSYDPVTRVELKKDPRFNGFVMFKQGGAQGKNPWILTDDQWCAIADHVPEWTALNYPKKPYSVRVECDFLRGEPNQLLGDFREVIMSGDYEWLGFSARTEQETVHEWDEYSVPYFLFPVSAPVRRKWSRGHRPYRHAQRKTRYGLACMDWQLPATT